MKINTCYNEDVFETLKKCKKSGQKFKMIWGDPDYNVNIDYTGKKYTKKWSEYINWYAELSSLCLDVLEDNGHLFLLNYPKPNSHLRSKYLESPELDMLKFNSSDKVYSVKEYVWIYNSNIGMSNKHYTTAHRTILHITKSKNAKLNNSVFLPYKNDTNVKNKTIKKNIIQLLSDVRKIKIIGNPIEKRDIKNKIWKIYLEKKTNISENNKIKTIIKNIENIHLKSGRKPYSWISMDELQLINSNSKVYFESTVIYQDLLKNNSKYKTIHPCQIPPELFSTLVSSSTEINEKIFVLFGGSGEELKRSIEMKRKFISSEIHNKYFKMIVNKIK